MAGVPTWFASNGEDSWTQFGLWVHIGFLPPNDTMLFEMKNGSVLDYQCILQTGGSVVSSWDYQGNHLTVQHQTVTLMDPGNWYWVSGIVGGRTIGVDFSIGGAMMGKVTGPGGVTDGVQLTELTTGPVHAAEELTCDVGWGVHFTGTYDDFPNASGWEMKGLWIRTSHLGSSRVNEGVQTIPVPTSDPTPDAPTRGLWLCNQALGPAVSIIDSSSLHNDLVPGPHNATIVSAGPY